jgi:hypothetical protein
VWASASGIFQFIAVEHAAFDMQFFAVPIGNDECRFLSDSELRKFYSDQLSGHQTALTPRFGETESKVCNKIFNAMSS